jgi:DNA-binding protein H-NS
MVAFYHDDVNGDEPMKAEGQSNATTKRDNAMTCNSAGVVPMLEEHLDQSSPSIVSETADGNNSTGARDLASMSVDELWALRESIDAILTAKISAELTELRRQLDRLSPGETDTGRHSSRKRLKARLRKNRPSLPVVPKYQNPLRPRQTWSGRGRRPLWLKEQMVSGKPLEDFSIT